jgi:hypothetical protein
MSSPRRQELDEDSLTGRFTVSIGGSELHGAGGRDGQGGKDSGDKLHRRRVLVSTKNPKRTQRQNTKVSITTSNSTFDDAFIIIK